MIIPIGLDETRIGRLPWVSISILVLNIVAFVATSAAGGEQIVEARYHEVVGYWRDHPYLELPPGMQQRFGVTKEVLARATRTRIPDAAPAGSEAAQAHLDALCEELFQALDETPERRWSLVPARGVLQPGWVSATGPQRIRIVIRGPGTGDADLVFHEFQINVQANAPIEYSAPQPVAGIRWVRFETLTADGWVIWHELEVYP